jgi:hypothetical protein
VLDVLISPFQPVDNDPKLLNWVSNKPWWTGRLPNELALPALAAAVGAVRVAEDSFCPFFHEIVAVEPAEDPDSSPEPVGEVWPGYLAGAMLLVRAGFVVHAGANVMDPVAASRSRMYWAWWRRNRQPTDLSHGWGPTRSGERTSAATTLPTGCSTTTLTGTSTSGVVSFPTTWLGNWCATGAI